MKKTLFFLFLAGWLIFLVGINLTLAQELTNTDTNAAGLSENADEVDSIINGETEAVQASELTAPEPKVLPNSPWYWAKSLWRSLKSVATLDPVKKAEYRLQIANERLLELQKLAEAGTISEEQMAKILEKYGQEIEKLGARLEKAKEKYQERVNRLLDKYGDQELVRQRLLKRVREKVQLEIVEQVRKKSLENFGEVLDNFDINKDKIEERLNTILEKRPALKNLHNLEVLNELAEKLPEEARAAIERAQENALKRIEAKLGELTDAAKKEFIEKYLADDPEAVRSFIINHLENLSADSALRNQLRKIRTNIKQVREQVVDDDLDFTNNCVCLELYQPVCGSDGKIYGNECKAQCVGAKVILDGCNLNSNRQGPSDNDNSSSINDDDADEGLRNNLTNQNRGND